MSWLSRIRSEPVHAPAGWQQNQNELLQQLISPITPTTAAKSRDPNAPDYRYQVNQKCIYERELPGGSYITAHIQRLQSGYYDSDVVHEDLVENVRFVAINFVFHPSRKDYRFKSAEISVAIHHSREDKVTPIDVVRNSIGIPDSPGGGDHDHATQTETVSNALVRSSEALPRPRIIKPATSRPKFIRHSPHLLYGSISPETLNWNFNLAGSVGASYGPANASFKPSYGQGGSYKVYEMMRIQGSVRTLRSWYGHQYDVEDGEIVWTLEENTLQKSGLPREFTFVMLLTKGSGGIEPSDDITIDIDIHPKVSGPMGYTYPKVVTGAKKFQPFRKTPVNLDQELGQVFEPSIKGKGFNFANLATSFDDFVWLPGTTYSATDSPSIQSSAPQQQSQQQQPQQSPQAQLPRSQSQNQQQRRLTSPSPADQTMTLRVILENSRGSPVHMNGNQFLTNGLPFVQLKAPSRTPSRRPSPVPRSIAGSHKSKRSIIITSKAPSSSRTPSQRKRHSYAGSQSQSRHVSGVSTSSQPQTQLRQVSHTHSLRKTRSRSGLDKEYIRSESPEEPKNQSRSQTFHDAQTDLSPQLQSQSLAGSADESENEIDKARELTPRYGDEAAQPYVQEVDDTVQARDYADEIDEHPELQPLPETPPSRGQRFPSLSQTYSQREKARQPHALVTNPGLAPPRTPPPPSSVYSAQPLTLQRTQDSPPPPVPEGSDADLAQEESEADHPQEARGNSGLAERVQEFKDNGNRTQKEVASDAAAANEADSARGIAEESILEEEPAVDYAQETGQRQLLNQGSERDLSDHHELEGDSPTPPPIQHARPQPISELEREISTPTPPQTAKVVPDHVAMTPPETQPRQSMDHNEPTLDPSTQLDPSTPKWHQHTSSPPSAPSTSSTAQPPPHFANFSSSKSNPYNATPRAPPKAALDYTPTAAPKTSLAQTPTATGNWNDTPPEWASPNGSGSNTPTRNRSLRTRQATQRALAMQDSIATQTVSKSLSDASAKAKRGKETLPMNDSAASAKTGLAEYDGASKSAMGGNVPGRQNSLHISAGPNARAAKRKEKNALPPTSYTSKQTSANAGCQNVRYSYPSVPPSTGSGHARTQSDTQPPRSQSEDNYRSPSSHGQNQTQAAAGTSIGFPSATSAITSKPASGAPAAQQIIAAQRHPSISKRPQDPQLTSSLPPPISSTAQPSTAAPTSYTHRQNSSHSSIRVARPKPLPSNSTSNPATKAAKAAFTALPSQQPKAPDHVTSANAAARESVRSAQARESIKKFRDAQAELAQAEKTHAQAKLAQRYGAEAGYWGTSPEVGRDVGEDGGDGGDECEFGREGEMGGDEVESEGTGRGREVQREAERQEMVRKVMGAGMDREGTAKVGEMGSEDDIGREEYKRLERRKQAGRSSDEKILDLDASERESLRRQGQESAALERQDRDLLAREESNISALSIDPVPIETGTAEAVDVRSPQSIGDPKIMHFGGFVGGHKLAQNQRQAQLQAQADAQARAHRRAESESAGGATRSLGAASAVSPGQEYGQPTVLTQAQSGPSPPSGFRGSAGDSRTGSRRASDTASSSKPSSRKGSFTSPLTGSRSNIIKSKLTGLFSGTGRSRGSSQSTNQTFGTAMSTTTSAGEKNSRERQVLRKRNRTPTGEQEYLEDRDVTSPSGAAAAAISAAAPPVPAVAEADRQRATSKNRDRGAGGVTWSASTTSKPGSRPTTAEKRKITNATSEFYHSGDERSDDEGGSLGALKHRRAEEVDDEDRAMDGFEEERPPKYYDAVTLDHNDENASDQENSLGAGEHEESEEMRPGSWGSVEGRERDWRTMAGYATNMI